MADLEHVDVGPPPCDACPLYVKCRHERLACRQFGEYLESTRWSAGQRTPTRERYQRLFNEGTKPTSAPKAARKRRSAYVERVLAVLAGGAT